MNKFFGSAICGFLIFLPYASQAFELTLPEKVQCTVVGISGNSGFNSFHPPKIGDVVDINTHAATMESLIFKAGPMIPVMTNLVREPVSEWTTHMSTFVSQYSDPDYSESNIVQVRQGSNGKIYGTIQSVTRGGSNSLWLMAEASLTCTTL